MTNSVRTAVAFALTNAYNYPEVMQRHVLGRDMSKLIDKVVETIEEVKDGELDKAEAELLAWVRGERSYTNEQYAVENFKEDGTPDRGETLVRIAQRDAAEIQCQINRVQALRLLGGKN